MEPEEEDPQEEEEGVAEAGRPSTKAQWSAINAIVLDIFKMNVLSGKRKLIMLTLKNMRRCC